MNRLAKLSIVTALVLGAGLLFIGCANDHTSEDASKLLLLMPQQQKFFPEMPQGVAQ